MRKKIIATSIGRDMIKKKGESVDSEFDSDSYREEREHGKKRSTINRGSVSGGYSRNM